MIFEKHICPMIDYFFENMNNHETSDQKKMVAALLVEQKNIKAIAAACEATSEFEDAKEEVEKTCVSFEETTPKKDRLFLTFNWLLNRHRLASNPEEKRGIILLFPIVARYLPKK